MDLSRIDSPNFSRALQYAKDIAERRQKANIDRILACQRFLDDLEREDLEFRQEDFDFVIDYIETCVKNVKGEDIDGRPLPGRLMILTDWQIFAVVNLFGFFWPGTKIRRFTEALI